MTVQPTDKTDIETANEATNETSGMAASRHGAATTARQWQVL